MDKPKQRAVLKGFRNVLRDRFLEPVHFLVKQGRIIEASDVELQLAIHRRHTGLEDDIV